MRSATETPFSLNRSSQKGTASRATEKALATTCPAPRLPLGACGHGKKVMAVPGVPTSSP
jgi:hypothetical protein